MQTLAVYIIIIIATLLAIYSAIKKFTKKGNRCKCECSKSYKKCCSSCNYNN